jgi:hypothetical protein
LLARMPAFGRFLTFTRSEVGVGYDRIQGGADTAARCADRTEVPKQTFRRRQRRRTRGAAPASACHGNEQAEPTRSGRSVRAGRRRNPIGTAPNRRWTLPGLGPRLGPARLVGESTPPGSTQGGPS